VIILSVNKKKCSQIVYSKDLELYKLRTMIKNLFPKELQLNRHLQLNQQLHPS